MNRSRYLVAGVLAPLLAASWSLIVAAEPDASSPLGCAWLGYLLGTLFGQATVAAAWTALGPAPLLWRLPLALAWIGSLAIALIANVMLKSHGPGIDIILITGACLFVQWMVVQIPLWALALGFRMRLRHFCDRPPTVRERQFGIRQLLILTAIVAMVLGACRWLVAETAVLFQNTQWAAAAFSVSLAVAGIVMTLPLLFAALLPRFSWLAVTVVLILIALGTWYELALLRMIPGLVVGLDVWHLASINGFQAAWILVVAALVRLCGYGIGQPRGESPIAGPSANALSAESA